MGPYFLPDVISTVEKNFYVDDCLKSLPSEKKAVSLVKNLASLCLTGGFQLTKWVSNSREVLSNIPKEERASDMGNLDLNKDALPTERALGLLWCTESDTFKFNITQE